MSAALLLNAWQRYALNNVNQHRRYDLQQLQEIFQNVLDKALIKRENYTLQCIVTTDEQDGEMRYQIGSEVYEPALVRTVRWILHGNEQDLVWKGTCDAALHFTNALVVQRSRKEIQPGKFKHRFSFLHRGVETCLPTRKATAHALVNLLQIDPCTISDLLVFSPDKCMATETIEMERVLIWVKADYQYHKRAVGDLVRELKYQQEVFNTAQAKLHNVPTTMRIQDLKNSSATWQEVHTALVKYAADHDEALQRYANDVQEQQIKLQRNQVEHFQGGNIALRLAHHNMEQQAEQTKYLLQLYQGYKKKNVAEMKAFLDNVGGMILCLPAFKNARTQHQQTQLLGRLKAHLSEQGEADRFERACSEFIDVSNTKMNMALREMRFNEKDLERLSASSLHQSESQAQEGKLIGAFLPLGEKSTLLCASESLDASKHTITHIKKSLAEATVTLKNHHYWLHHKNQIIQHMRESSPYLRSIARQATLHDIYQMGPCICDFSTMNATRQEGVLQFVKERPDVFWIINK